MYDGRILYARSDACCVIKLIDELRYGLGPAFSDFVDRLFAMEGLGRVVIDLSETTFLDSTILGLLARLGLRCRETLDRNCLIVSPREEITEQLLGMGIDQFFILVTEFESEIRTYTAVPAEQPDRQALAATLLEAHRTLVGMNAKNRAMFQDAVAEMERSFGEGR